MFKVKVPYGLMCCHLSGESERQPFDHQQRWNRSRTRNWSSVEADRSTTTQSRFTEKLLAYWHYLEQGLHTKKYAIKPSGCSRSPSHQNVLKVSVPSQCPYFPNAQGNSTSSLHSITPHYTNPTRSSVTSTFRRGSWATVFHSFKHRPLRKTRPQCFNCG